MIGLEDRRSLAHDIDAAHKPGARLRLACEVAGIDERTLQRWKAHAGLAAAGALQAALQGHGRPQAVRSVPAGTP